MGAGDTSPSFLLFSLYESKVGVLNSALPPSIPPQEYKYSRYIVIFDVS